MKLTCLTKGNGYHSPPSHIIDLFGFRLLIDCPLDLSALTAFTPLHADDDAAGLISSSPWYKTPKALHLWNPAIIDAVLVSSPAGMLGLPFLTRDPRFSAAVYATEAAARIGRLMMEELVDMHGEFVRFYGVGEEAGCPEWMRWEEIKRLDPVVRDVMVGEDGEELGSWMSLTSPPSPPSSPSCEEECDNKTHVAV